MMIKGSARQHYDHILYQLAPGQSAGPTVPSPALTPPPFKTPCPIRPLSLGHWTFRCVGGSGERGAQAGLHNKGLFAFASD